MVDHAALMTVAPNWTKLFATNSTNGSFVSPAPSITRPSGDGVIDWNPEAGGAVQNGVMLKFIGTDADNEAANVRVYQWAWCPDLTTPGNLDKGLWERTCLGQFLVTLSAITGIGSRVVASTDFYADTIAAATAWTAQDGVSFNIVSPENDLPGHLVLDMKGPQLLQVEFDLTTAASMNCLARVY
jgi:hypothetical protein